jgi:hypothetical protein
MRILVWQDYFAEPPHHKNLAERANNGLELTAPSSVTLLISPRREKACPPRPAAQPERYAD